MRTTDRRVVAALLVATLPLGCYKWSGTMIGSPAEVVHERSPSKLQVMLDRDSTVTLQPYVLEGDVLRGMERRSGVTHDHVIALSDVRAYRVRELDVWNTTQWIAAGVGSAVLLAFIIDFRTAGSH